VTLFGDPAVAELGIVLNLVEGGVNLAELLADALDEGSDVGAVAVGSILRSLAGALDDIAICQDLTKLAERCEELGAQIEQSIRRDLSKPIHDQKRNEQ
jgi:hypothetical protein